MLGLWLEEENSFDDPKDIGIEFHAVKFTKRKVDNLVSISSSIRLRIH